MSHPRPLTGLFSSDFSSSLGFDPTPTLVGKRMATNFASCSYVAGYFQVNNRHGSCDNLAPEPLIQINLSVTPVILYCLS
jgi:hypothetical protein